MENLKKHLFPGSRSTGGSESKSVFHIDDGERMVKEVQGCFESVEEFQNAMKNLDGAGTHLTESLTKSLRDTQHNGIADTCGLAFRHVYASEQVVLVSQQLHEMSAALKELHTRMEDTTANFDSTAADYSQTLCKILLMFLRCQQSYHKFCSEKMLDLVKKLALSKGLQNQDEVTEHLFSLVLSDIEDGSKSEKNVANHSSPTASPKGSPKTKKANSSSSSKSPAKHTLKSSLRSFFERKSSPEEGKSAFYVDVESNAAGCNANGELDSTSDKLHTAGRPQTEQNHPVGLRSGEAFGAVPQANLLGLDFDQGYQGQVEDNAQNHMTSMPNLSLIGSGQNQFPNMAPKCFAQGTYQAPSARGHILGNVGQGHMLLDLIGPSESSETKSGPASHIKPSGHGMDALFPSTLNSLVDPQSLQFHPGFAASKGNFMELNGQLASEEELESVINLLSGVNLTGAPMQAIPENQVQGPVQLTVPQIYRMPSPASDTHVEEIKHPKYQMHRRSEGCLDLTGVRTNAWPHQHVKPSLPLAQFGPPKQHMDLPQDPALYMRRYSQDMHMPYRQNPGYMAPNVGHVMPGSHWNYGGSGTWPSAQTGKGTSTVNSSWSGVQDSSDLSDDSSSGEQFYAVGRDLVQAIDLKDDSSDDDLDEHQGTRDCLRATASETDHQEKSSVHTWPPKQQWSHSSLYLNAGVTLDPSENPQFHRPVQMQWSDPMSSRSMWPAGPSPLVIPPQRTSQSMQGFGTLQ